VDIAPRLGASLGAGFRFDISPASDTYSADYFATITIGLSCPLTIVISTYRLSSTERHELFRLFVDVVRLPWTRHFKHCHGAHTCGPQKRFGRVERISFSCRGFLQAVFVMQSTEDRLHFDSTIFQNAMPLCLQPCLR
jgi:hypothetical protein